jgi:hypothetical protein
MLRSSLTFIGSVGQDAFTMTKSFCLIYFLVFALNNFFKLRLVGAGVVDSYFIVKRAFRVLWKSSACTSSNTTRNGPRLLA